MINKKIYLDYAATTPLSPEVRMAMEKFWSDSFANPGSLHLAGQEALVAVDNARDVLKKFLGADFSREIIFTGSATEANNLAIIGLIKKARPKTDREKAHVITTLIEHESVLEPVRALERNGVINATFISPDKNGLITAKQIKEEIRPETVLVSVGYANNEIGVIQPIGEIAKMISSLGRENIYFHTDAAQAAQFLDMSVKNLKVDMMTLSAHKIYGPKGIGALYVRNGIKLESILYGGGQEYGLRSSTENVPLIVGFAEAVGFLGSRAHKESVGHISKLKNDLLGRLESFIPGIKLNGSGEKRLPNNLNLCFDGLVEGGSLLIALSGKGVCVSSGAACSGRAQKPSHVLRAIGLNEQEARSSLRITLGRYTTNEEITQFITILVDLIKNFGYNKVK